jgi:hypothetical protein
MTKNEYQRRESMSKVPKRLVPVLLFAAAYPEFSFRLIAAMTGHGQTTLERWARESGLRRGKGWRKA